MRRNFRLAIGSLIIAAVGCASASQIAKKLPAAERVKLELGIIEAACAECALDVRCIEDLRAVCAPYLEPPTIGPADGGTPVNVGGSGQ